MDLYQRHRRPDQQVKCSTAVVGGKIGGYAFSYNMELENNTIVLCEPFWDERPLVTVIEDLEEDRKKQKDPTWMNGKARMLLHEITHLTGISRTHDGKRLQYPRPAYISLTKE